MGLECGVPKERPENMSDAASDKDPLWGKAKANESHGSGISRVRRVRKNNRERERRLSINDKFKELNQVVGSRGMNKAGILGEAIRKIRWLRAVVFAAET